MLKENEMNRRGFLTGLFGTAALAALTPIAGFAVWDRARVVRLPATFVIHYRIIGATPEDMAKLNKLTTARAA